MEGSMRTSTDRILTTHTGSLPRPRGLDTTLAELDRGQLSEADRNAFPGRVREAVIATVARQADVGVDVVSDGEMSKFGYATYVKQRLTGFDGADEPLALADLADYPEFAKRIALEITTPACTGAVTFRGEDAVQADIDNLRAATEGASVEEAFLSAASPGVISEFLANRFYANDEGYLYALADAMKHEYDAIAEAGFLLQLDCPDLAMGRHLHVPPLDVTEFRKEVERRVEVINHATRDIDPHQLRIHLCWGNYEAPHHHDVPLEDIFDIVLRARPAAILFEAANPRHEHEWQVFEDVTVPDGKVIAPGVIDTLTNYIEHPELVAQRIVRYANAVGREAVMAGTDCGFATFANFLSIDPDIAWGKLKSLADGAELASRRLWRSTSVGVTA
jgi:5-methyltetrahydropteroyltriglutamate--homocysteine methyltransferase